MKQIRKPHAIIAMVLAVLLLGGGAASAATLEAATGGPVATTATPAQTTVSMTVRPALRTIATDEPDRLHVPAGSTHHRHRDERLENDEYELANAAPHTLGRFDSGTA